MCCEIYLFFIFSVIFLLLLLIVRGSKASKDEDDLNGSPNDLNFYSDDVTPAFLSGSDDVIMGNLQDFTSQQELLDEENDEKLFLDVLKSMMLWSSRKRARTKSR